MSKLSGANDSEKLKELCTKTYKEQAVWFLNAFWEDFAQKEAEHLWNYVQKMNSLDLQKGKDGCEVDELNAHRFLEHFKETQTVREMRDNLRDTGAISGNIKMFPLEHHLIFRYKADWHKLVNAPQGDNSKEIAKAQQMLDEVQTAFKEAEAKAQEAKSALKEAESKEADAKKAANAARAAEDQAKSSEAEAKKKEAEAKAAAAEAKAREDEAKAAAAEAKAKEDEALAREADARAAQEELEKALQDLREQEDAYRKKTEELQARSEDESTGVVQRNKAKNELSQHLAKDPLPLSRAKITQEAAVKKADKATQAAATARENASASRAAADKAAQNASASRAAADKAAQNASASRAAAEQAAREAEAARKSAEQAAARAAEAKEAAARAAKAAEDAADEMARKVDEAEAYLQEVKNQPGCAYGAIWWMERELEEQKKYMPERKGGKKKN